MPATRAILLLGCNMKGSAATRILAAFDLKMNLDVTNRPPMDTLVSPSDRSLFPRAGSRDWTSQQRVPSVAGLRGGGRALSNGLCGHLAEYSSRWTRIDFVTVSAVGRTGQLYQIKHSDQAQDVGRLAGCLHWLDHTGRAVTSCNQPGASRALCRGAVNAMPSILNGSDGHASLR